jgi:hypothetical protein
MVRSRLRNAVVVAPLSEAERLLVHVLEGLAVPFQRSSNDSHAVLAKHTPSPLITEGYPPVLVSSELRVTEGMV